MYRFKPSNDNTPLEYYTEKNPYLKNLCQELDKKIEDFYQKSQNKRSFTPTPPSTSLFDCYVKAEPLFFDEIGALLLHLLDKHIEKVYGNCFAIRKCRVLKKYNIFSCDSIYAEGYNAHAIACDSDDNNVYYTTTRRPQPPEHLPPPSDES